MNKKLKDAIIVKIQSNTNEFQLTNFIVDSFKKYIYDKNGMYLIGGKEVKKFIDGFINIYIN